MCPIASARHLSKEFKDVIHINGEWQPIIEQSRNKRNRIYGRILTYSRKVFIPLTRLCRNDCAYCVFSKTPDEVSSRYLLPYEVLRIAETGKRAGCREALITLGERPEEKYLEARQALNELGFDSTIEYVHHICKLIIKETHLLPHVNAGSLRKEEIKMLKPVTASLGMMLESSSERLSLEGMPHYNSPDKNPEVRLSTLKYAGEMNVPFTTGILIGIGETLDERIKSLCDIEEIFKEYSHIQEVIIQNFRAKEGTPMSSSPEPTIDDMIKTIAAARLILSPEISLQAPPNLESDYAQYVDAGVNDWGGISPVTPDHINPLNPWPKIEDLSDVCEDKGFQLKERLTLYPRFIKDYGKFIDENMKPLIFSLSDENGFAR